MRDKKRELSLQIWTRRTALYPNACTVISIISLALYLSYENPMFFSMPLWYFEEMEGKFTVFLSWVRHPDSGLTFQPQYTHDHNFRLCGHVRKEEKNSIWGLPSGESCQNKTNKKTVSFITGHISSAILPYNSHGIWEAFFFSYIGSVSDLSSNWSLSLETFYCLLLERRAILNGFQLHLE